MMIGHWRIVIMASVLVVDDNADVLSAVCSMLHAAGYTVEKASDGTAALEIIERKAIDLLLTDVVMRGLNGFNLARMAVRRRPGIKVLYYSGFTEFTIGPDEGAKFGKLLRKPLHPEDLHREVAQALAATL
jgi:CheY-like chemotaxis protein